MRINNKIPYVSNPGNACALACYTMTAKYFFPETTFNEVAKISDWEPGYVIWPFKFWLWIMDQGIKIVDYDLIDYERWVNEGLDGLKKSAGKAEFEFYLKNTKKLESYDQDIKKVLDHPNFTYNRKKPEFIDLERVLDKGVVCEVVLNADVLNGKEGFNLHRVVILDINENKVAFHDPRREENLPPRIENKDLFEKAWLGINEPELCIYSKNL